jgi:DNA-binding transcriptional MerR regulator
MASDLRISDLAEDSGLPLATIKFYLREGLLPRGTATARTQATYGEAHLSRLRLIQILTDAGGLSIARAKALLDAVDDGNARSAVHVLTPEREVPGWAVEAADAFIDRELGWRVPADSPARRALARSLVELRSVGRADDLAVLKPHARAADWLVSEETEDQPDDLGRAVAATVAFDAAVTALRHLAWEHRISPARTGHRVQI